MSEDNKVPPGYWQDARGALMPVDKIKPIDKARDKAVRVMVDQAKKMSAVLAQFKLASLTEIDAFVAQSAEEYGAKLGGKKGNVTLVSYDGKFKVIRAMQETLVFDERLQVAKGLIDECMQGWSKGSNKNLVVLVKDAFQVDKEGKISTGRVLGLRRHAIDDPKWQAAMKAIGDSVTTASTKTHLRFYERNDATGEYLPIPLDVSAT